MRVLCVDADSHNGFSNLALMKISAWHKNRGDSVTLIKGIPSTAPLVRPDKMYLSCIFSQNKDAALDYASQFSCDVELGGSGIDLKKELPYEIEHIMPDYSLYGTDFSMGFTSRGCIRKCPWCIVPHKEGRIKDHAPITEFLYPGHTKVIILDNNFQASPNWRENLKFIIDNELHVNINQGLDIRLMTKEFAKLLSQAKYSTWKFNTKRLHFAFDSPHLEKHIRRGVSILNDAGINNLMCYVLVGFNTTLKQDLHRIDVLIDLGVDPFVMRYNSTKGQNDILMHLARWVNKRIHRNVKFVDYDYAGSQEAISLAKRNGLL